jgi:hypothetical protein
MKIKMRIISDRRDLAKPTMTGTTEALFLTFRPTVADILELVQHPPGPLQIRLASGHEKTLNRATRTLLKMNNIKLKSYSIQGRKNNEGAILEVDE